MIGTPRRISGGAFCLSCILAVLIAAGSTAALAAQQTDSIIVARDVKIAMRTGAPLRARIYRPPGNTRRPAILSIEADTSAARDRNARELAAAGYAVVIAAPRAGDDDRRTGRDGYDAVEWVNGQSWSDQRIVMSGEGEGANAAWDAARERPPHLAAILARAPARRLGWSQTDLERTVVSALSIAGSTLGEQGMAIETDSAYAGTSRLGGAPEAYLVIGAFPESLLAELEREWFDWAVGRANRPTLLRNHVNYLMANDSTWRAAPSIAAIHAVPTRFPLHTNAGPRNAPGGFLGDAARDDEPVDTVSEGGKEYKALLGAALDVVGRPSVTLWADRAPQAGFEVALDNVLADGTVISLGRSAGRLMPADSTAAKNAPRKWEFDVFAWMARELVGGSMLRLTVRGAGAVLYHDTERYSRVVLPVVRGRSGERSVSK
jgi:hypothetical protein